MTEGLDELLAQAEAIETTAPWQETRVLLDRIRPLLTEADPERQARFAYLDARNHALSGDFLKGLAIVRRALELDISAPRRIHLLRLGANLAVIAREFEQSFTMLREALEWLDRPDVPPGDYGVDLLASYLYARVGEHDSAIDYGLRAIQVARRYGDARSLCLAQQRLAYGYKAAGRHEEAERTYRSAIAQCEQAGDRLTEGVAEAGLADLYRELGRFEGLEPLFEQAIEKLEAAQYPSGVAEARLYWSRLAMALGKPELAAGLLERALPEFQRSQNWAYLAESHRRLAEIAEADGDLRQALEHYRHFIDAREIELNHERIHRIAYLETEFGVRDRERQLALLEAEARSNELRAEVRRQQMRVSIATTAMALMLLGVLAVLLVRSARDRRRYQDLSRRDSLTRLLNHSTFFSEAEAVRNQCAAEGRPCTLLLADIDHFKRINDAHGHAVGDQVLKTAAARLNEVFGDRGLVGRIGGEEFAVLLPGVRPDDLAPLIEQLAERLRRIRADDLDLPITMSFGLVDCSDAPSLASCREHADQALYDAKTQGRDRTVIAGAPASA